MWNPAFVKRRAAPAHRVYSEQRPCESQTRCFLLCVCWQPPRPFVAVLRFGEQRGLLGAQSLVCVGLQLADTRHPGENRRASLRPGALWDQTQATVWVHRPEPCEHSWTWTSSCWRVSGHTRATTSEEGNSENFYYLLLGFKLCRLGFLSDRWKLSAECYLSSSEDPCRSTVFQNKSPLTEFLQSYTYFKEGQHFL